MYLPFWLAKHRPLSSFVYTWRHIPSLHCVLIAWAAVTDKVCAWVAPGVPFCSQRDVSSRHPGVTLRSGWPTASTPSPPGRQQGRRAMLRRNLEEVNGPYSNFTAQHLSVKISVVWSYRKVLMDSINQRRLSIMPASNEINFFLRLNPSFVNDEHCKRK